MKFRPADDPRHTDAPDSHLVDWEDNAVSNTFAWASYKFLPSWCESPEHWTSRLTQYLFTDCPCCLLFRGIAVGVVLGLAFGTVANLAVILTVVALR
ncbi:hypothetical protein CQ14_06765 [Bradyrhizobium lablabi]|uniref:Uncharacterized protein n=1 Tax=Bradyrhizobium lablabi TaxID=722472 RepID=A0A0R3MN27_9BRAD|nr:hypothetical protein [Bradyrhizobium lablabi]KRR21345.1 hypothetical protein CQ14_06765 [Bradyrhizobium lablabi]